MKGRVAVIGREVAVGYGLTELAFAGMWTPMGSAPADGRAPRAAQRQRGSRQPHLAGAIADACEPTACVLERIEWSEVAEDGAPLDEYAQRKVVRISRMQLPHLHPELQEDWAQLRRNARAVSAGRWRRSAAD